MSLEKKNWKSKIIVQIIRMMNIESGCLKSKNEKRKQIVLDDDEFVSLDYLH